MKHFKPLLILAALMTALGLGGVASAQVTNPVGVTTDYASQLVFWFMITSEVDSLLQVTNASNTESVDVHIQIWSNDGLGDPVTDPCRETNFVDSYTPNDTHVYDLLDISRNDGASFTLNLLGADGNGFVEGFVTVTPVVSTSDGRAIAFNNMFGTLEINIDTDLGARVNAMGREAKSFLTGDLLPDGTVLDGVTGGYVLLQPNVLMFNYSGTGGAFPASEDEMSAVSITFRDDYAGPFDGYSSRPADLQIDTLILNDAEVPTSCQRLTSTCVLDLGLNEVIVSLADDFGRASPENTNIFCPGNSLDLGWTRLSISGLDADTLENALGFTLFLNFDEQTAELGGAGWMVAVGDVVSPTPTPTPTPSPTPTPTPTPSPSGGGGGGGGCAIAGPVSAGTAVANMLIVLLPGAALALRMRRPSP